MKREDNGFDEAADGGAAQNASETRGGGSKKVLAEIKDILVGLAFPVIVMLVISSTILVYASYTEDLAVSLIACIGGEILLTASLVIFGRANGLAAYKKTALNAQKRELGSREEGVLNRTGEYALWKGALIGVILALPFIIFQSIQLGAPNKILPVAAHTLGYYLGKLQALKIQLDESGKGGKKGKRRRK